MDEKNLISVTEPMFWQMPHIDSQLAGVKGSTIFALIDFDSGLWQLPLEAQSPLLLAFQTMDSVIKPT